MAFRYTLCQHTVPDWDPVTMIQEAARIGYDGVSIRSIPQGVTGEIFFGLADNPTRVSEIERALKDTNIIIHDIDLVSITEDRNIGELETTFAVASHLGVKGVVTSIWTPDYQAAALKYQELCELALRYKLEVYLEFVTWSDLKDLKDAAALLSAFGKSNSKILIDTLHWRRSQVKLDDLKICPQNWFPYVHICDIDSSLPDTNEELAYSGRNLRLYPGEGVAPIRQIIDELPENLWLGIEIPNTLRRQTLGSFEYAKQCLMMSKKLLESQ